MSLIRLRHGLASPLARHPRLLARKIRDRLVGPAAFAFTNAPASIHCTIPPNLSSGLRRWQNSATIRPDAWPHSRLFQQDFEPAYLWERCRVGPTNAADLSGDIKLIWEFSRSHGVFTAALQGRCEHEFVSEWIRRNPDPDGPAWSCPMDVAIRAINWITADTLLDGQLSASVGLDPWISNLWNSGRLIFQRLETRLICSNHYLADLLGLLFIGKALQQHRWIQFARDEFPRALTAQSYADGGVYEASLPYHALVTEMALLFALASGDAQPRLPDMCQVLADAMDVDGDVFQVGDNDSGRILPMDFVADKTGRAQALLKLAEIVTQKTYRARAEAKYSDSGWWIRRKGDWTVFLEYGGVGMAGLGGHAHNDDLSICVNWRNHRVLVDPGSYLYTPAPDVRNALRSVRSHNCVSIDGVEPRFVPQKSWDDIFSLPGVARAFDLQQIGDSTVRVTRDWPKHRMKHVRTLDLKDDAIVIEDQIQGNGAHQIQWHWQLAPGIKPQYSTGSITLEGSGLSGLLRTHHEGILVRERDALFSQWYGSAIPTKQLTGELRTGLPCSVKWELKLRENPAG